MKTKQRRSDGEKSIIAFFFEMLGLTALCSLGAFLLVWILTQGLLIGCEVLGLEGAADFISKITYGTAIIIAIIGIVITIVLTIKELLRERESNEENC